MIWIAVGVLSIFWDPYLDVYLPLIPVYILGTYWTRSSPFLTLSILYLHHLLHGENWFYELSLLVSLMLTTSIDEYFYDERIPYIILSGITFVIVLVFVSPIAAVLTAAEALIVYSLRWV